MKYKTVGGIELEGTPQEIAEYFYEKHKIEERQEPANGNITLEPIPIKTLSADYKAELNRVRARRCYEKKKAELEAKREKKREYQRNWLAKRRGEKVAIKNQKPKAILGVALKTYIANQDELSLEKMSADLESKGIKIKKSNLRTYIKVEQNRREKVAQKVAPTPETAQNNDVFSAIATVFGGQ